MPSFCRVTTGFGLNTRPLPSTFLTRDSTLSTAPLPASTTVRMVPRGVSVSETPRSALLKASRSSLFPPVFFTTRTPCITIPLSTPLHMS